MTWIELTPQQQRSLMEFGCATPVQIEPTGSGVYRGPVLMTNARGESATVDERGTIRLGESMEPPTRIECEGLVIDRVSREATLDGEPIALSVTEFDFLVLLASAPYRCWAKAEIYRLVWNGDWGQVSTRTIDAHACRLRRRLGNDRRWIVSVRGYGYRLCNEIPVAVAA